MSEGFYLGAYWGSRRESLPACADRLTTCLGRLGEIDPSLASWFERARSRRAATSEVALEPESMRNILNKGVNRRDEDGRVLAELGYSVGLWNRAKPTIGLGCTVGAHPSSKGILNCFVLDFPPPEAEAQRLYEPSVAKAILEVIVEAWEPSWATWTSHSLLRSRLATSGALEPTP